MTDTPAAFEAKKDRLYQTQDGLWKLTLTVQQCDMPDWLLRAPMGQRIGAAALHEIGDDEKPVSPAQEGRQHPLHRSGKLSAQDPVGKKTEGERAVIRAVMLCKDEEFQRWTVKQCDEEQLKEPLAHEYEANDESWARAVILKNCGVASRSELKTNSVALDKFLKMETSFRYRNELR